MKVAMFTANLDRSAQEEGFIVDWVEALAKQVDELVVFVVKPQKTKPAAQNIRVYELTQKGKLAKLIYLFKVFSKEHKRKPFNGTFTHMYDFLGACSGVLGKIFAVKSVFWYAGGIELPRFSLLEVALRLNNIIVTAAPINRKRYRDQYHLRKPIVVLGHGVNSERFSKRSGVKRHKKFILGTVGRVAESKNFPFLIEALAKVKAPKAVKVILVLAKADQDLRHFNYLKRLITRARNPQITFEMRQDVAYKDLPVVLKKFDLYIHPSLVKSVDKAGIEAIMTGVPVLLSRYGYEKLCRNAPEVLFDPQNRDEFVKKTQNALNNYGIFRKKQATLQKKVRETYSIDVFMKKVAHLYED